MTREPHSSQSICPCMSPELALYGSSARYAVRELQKDVEKELLVSVFGIGMHVISLMDSSSCPSPKGRLCGLNLASLLVCAQSCLAWTIIWA
jgi:hypothetical protein